jgi:hypothetical protein
MKKILIALVVLTAASPALGAKYRPWTPPVLLQRWKVLNERCRGGSGREPATKQACDERKMVDAALFARGYCYVGMGATSRWVKGPASRWTSRGAQAVCH